MASDANEPRRTFIAIHPSAAQRAALERTVERLADGAQAATRAVRWVDAAQAHLTLAFLGDVAASRLAEVERAVRDAALEHPRFEIGFRDVGAFPDARAPRVVWLGVREGRDEVVELAGALRRALAPLGFADEDASFRPHLTLGRVRASASPEERDRVADAIASNGAGAGTDGATVREVAVVTSVTRADGAVHEVLARLPLGTPGDVG